MAYPEVDESFLDTSLGEQSAFLTEKDLDPAYRVTKVQETVPAAPPISVRGNVDQFASQDLSNIISTFQDPTSVKERRKREQEVRDAIARRGGAGELFVSEPDINLDTPKVTSLAVDTNTVPRASVNLSGNVSPDYSNRMALREDIEQLEKSSVDNPFDFTAADYRRFAKELSYNVATDEVAVPEIAKGIFKGGKYALDKLGLTGGFQGSAFIRNPQSYYQTMTGGGLGVPDSSGLLAKDAATGATTYAPSSAVAQGQTSAVQSGANIGTGAAAAAVKYGGAAISAYNAYEAFKEKDYIQAGLSAGVTYATLTGNVGLALALTAASIAQSFFRFGKGKPKPGMGGSEIRYNKDTGNLEHGTTWSYNGFNPSQAKQHTDQTVKFVNNYMKEFGVSLDPKKFPQGQSNWQYLSRIDVSPYKNGSQSGAEMIERWLSSGAFVGNPSVYDPIAGERKYFNSQEEYEIAMQRFANKQFS